MIPLKTCSRILALLLALAVSAAPFSAQQRGASPPAQPKGTPQKANPPAPAKTNAKPQVDQAATTIDNLLAADSFKFYGEIRNVGQLVRSGNITDVLDPFLKLSSPPKEFKALVEFTNAHAESLATARMMVAAWPVNPKLPQFLVAIEFASVDEARKFEPQLRGVMPKIMPTPTPSPSPEPEETSAPPVAIPSTGEKKIERKPVVIGPTQSATEQKSELRPGPQVEEKPAPPPFVIKQIGTLVLLSDTAFNIKSLRPTGSTLLSEDDNFRHTHNRFVSDPIFIFFNVSLEDKVQAALEAQAADRRAKEPEIAADTAKDATADTPVAQGTEPAMEDPTVVLEPMIATDENGVPLPQTPGTLTAQPPPPPSPIDLGMNQLMGAVFGGRPKWPEAVGGAISFDGDGYVARVLLVNGMQEKASPVPIIPQLVSGPALALEAPSILPADTEILITASIDASQIYAGLVKALIENNERDEGYRRVSKETQPEVPFATLEKALGIKLKEDLVPILGNEIAISVPMRTFMGTPAPPTPGPSPSPGVEDDSAMKSSAPSPVVLISLKDKQAARLLLPRIIEGLGFKGAGMLAQTERRDETEIVSYANVFAYAFIGNFLVLSANAATTRHIVDSYLSHQTLSSDSHYRNSARWQPRQVAGQVYLSPALMESFRASLNSPASPVSEKLRELFQRLGPEAEPVTYALSNEGPGPLHELHVPKNLLLLAVASMVGSGEDAPLRSNESMARVALSSIASAEQQYRDYQNRGSYGTLDQLIAEGQVNKEFLESHGYRIELTVSGTRFEATAVPLEYGTTGRLSFFVDETGIIRAADHNGSPATAADQPAD